MAVANESVGLIRGACVFSCVLFIYSFGVGFIFD